MCKLKRRVLLRDKRNVKTCAQKKKFKTQVSLLYCVLGSITQGSDLAYGSSTTHADTSFISLFPREK